MSRQGRDMCSISTFSEDGGNVMDTGDFLFTVPRLAVQFNAVKPLYLDECGPLEPPVYISRETFLDNASKKNVRAKDLWLQLLDEGIKCGVVLNCGNKRVTAFVPLHIARGSVEEILEYLKKNVLKGIKKSSSVIGSFVQSNTRHIYLDDEAGTKSTLDAEAGKSTYLGISNAKSEQEQKGNLQGIVKRMGLATLGGIRYSTQAGNKTEAPPQATDETKAPPEATTQAPPEGTTQAPFPTTAFCQNACCGLTCSVTGCEVTKLLTWTSSVLLRLALEKMLLTVYPGKELGLGRGLEALSYSNDYKSYLRQMTTSNPQQSFLSSAGADPSCTG